LDGISNPAVDGFTTTPKPGQGPAVPAGTLLLGENGDFVPRPAWAKDGSFLVFRQLAQLVPEFDKFVTNNAIVKPGLTLQQGADLLGARMVGRWKSVRLLFVRSSFFTNGYRIRVLPSISRPLPTTLPSERIQTATTTSLLATPVKFCSLIRPGKYRVLISTELLAVVENELIRCPFSAHIRKSRPRADLGTPEDSSHHIMRAGIPYVLFIITHILELTEYSRYGPEGSQLYHILRTAPLINSI
jgi:hypothetical protein